MPPAEHLETAKPSLQMIEVNTGLTNAAKEVGCLFCNGIRQTGHSLRLRPCKLAHARSKHIVDSLENALGGNGRDGSVSISTTHIAVQLVY